MSVTIKGITPDVSAGTGVARTNTYSQTPGGTNAEGQLGTYHLANNSRYYEPQRENNFQFLVTGLENILRAGTSSEISNAQEVISLSVVTASIPSYSQEPITIQRGNSKIKYASVPTFNTGSLELNDYIGTETWAALQAWQNLSYNPYTEKVGLAQEYKKDCTLIAYSPDGQKVREWCMHGCWISDLNSGNFNNEGSGKKTISCTIQYDRAEIVWDKGTAISPSGSYN